MKLDIKLLDAAESLGDYLLDAHPPSLAEANNCELYHPAANEVLLDLDGEEEYRNYMQRFEFFDKMHAGFLEHTRDWPSKSGAPKRHVVLTASRDLSDVERVLLQTILGSDPNREMLNSCRYFKFGFSYNVLFKPKVAVPYQVPELF